MYNDKSKELFQMIFQNGSYKIFVLGSECFDSIDNNTKMTISQDHVNGLG